MTKKRKPRQNKEPCLVERNSKLRKKQKLNQTEVGQLLDLDSQEFSSSSSSKENSDSNTEDTEETIKRVVDHSMALIQVTLKKKKIFLPCHNFL